MYHSLEKMSSHLLRKSSVCLELQHEYSGLRIWLSNLQNTFSMCGRKAEGIGVNLKHCQYSKSQSVQKSEKWEQVLLEKQSYI